MNQKEKNIAGVKLGFDTGFRPPRYCQVQCNHQWNVLTRAIEINYMMTNSCLPWQVVGHLGSDWNSFLLCSQTQGLASSALTKCNLQSHLIGPKWYFVDIWIVSLKRLHVAIWVVCHCCIKYGKSQNGIQIAAPRWAIVATYRHTISEQIRFTAIQSSYTNFLQLD